MKDSTYFCSSETSALEEELLALEEELLALEEELLALEEELLALEEELLALEEELLASFTTEEELFSLSAGALEPLSSPQPASIKPRAAVIRRDL